MEPALTDSAAADKTFDPQHRLAIITCLGGLAVSFTLSFLSDGFYHDDDVGHFLMARSGWTDSLAMWHVWGRPGYNLPTMVVAKLFGMMGCRLFSGVLTAGTAYLAYLIARKITAGNDRLAKLAWFAPALVWLQPLAMTLSITTLTETPAALYLTAFVWLYLRRNRVWASAALSLLFVTRYETLALAPIAVVALLLAALQESQWNIWRTLRTGWLWASMVAMIWAPLAYVLAAIAVNLPEHASPISMFARSYTNEYGSGGWGHFVKEWMVAIGPAATVLAAIGVVRAGRRAWLPVALAVGMLVLHTLIFRFGSYASGGYARFLVPASGLVGALAAVGLSALGQIPDRDLAIVIVLEAVALAAIQPAFTVRPLTVASSGMHTAVDRGNRRSMEADLADCPALTSHVLFEYMRPNTSVTYHPQDAKERWLAAEPGTLYLWDNKYADAPMGDQGDEKLRQSLRLHGREIFHTKVNEFEVTVYQRTTDAVAKDTRIDSAGD